MIKNNKSYLNLFHKVYMDYHRTLQNPLQFLTVHIIKQPSSFTNKYRLQNHDPSQHSGTTIKDNEHTLTTYMADNKYYNLQHKTGYGATDNHWNKYQRTPSTT